MASSTPIWFLAITDPTLTPMERICLAVLARYQGGNESAWPSRANLAADLATTERNVRRLIVALENKGKIKVMHPDRQGRKQRNEYTVLIGKKGDAADTLFEAKGCHGGPQKGVISGHVTGVYKEEVVSEGVKGACGKTFTPPTAKQVREYAATLGNPIFPAERFIAYYGDLDWQDKNGKPVRSWRGRVRTWHNRENERRVEQGLPPLDGYSQYGTHKATWAEIEALQAEGVL